MATNYAKNLCSGTLASAISASATSLSVYVGEGSSSAIQGVWPSVPFYATIMPATPSAGVPNSLDSEIVKVTAVGSSGSNTTLTVTRGQRGTTTKAFSQGAIVTNADYAEDTVLLGDEGTSETETPWIGTDDIEDNAVTADKIDFTTLAKAKILSTSIPGGQYSITGRGIIYGIAEFQVGQYSYDVWGQLSVSGNSGSYVAPRAYQYQPYVKGQAHIFAMVAAGDTITISKTIEGGGGTWSDRGFLVFIPCNW